MNAQAIMRQMLQGLKTHPERLISDFEQAYPGITAGEASALAHSFIGLFDQQGGRKAWRQRANEYSAAVKAMAAKYPGGLDADNGLDLGFDLDIDIGL